MEFGPNSGVRQRCVVARAETRLCGEIGYNNYEGEPCPLVVVMSNIHYSSTSSCYCIDMFAFLTCTTKGGQYIYVAISLAYYYTSARV